MAERPTPEQIEEMRADVAEGRWGFVERDHPQIEDATGRLWYGTSDDAAGLRYGAWIDLSASRMAHLVRRAGYAETLLAEVDALTDRAVAAEQRAAGLEGALTKISSIRDSMIGMQGFNFSEHGYPLVAALDEVGFKGAGYKIARENLGTLIEQRDAAEQRAGTAELAYWQLREAAVALNARIAHDDTTGTYYLVPRPGHPDLDRLRALTTSPPTGLAEALRRELRAEGMEMARALVNAELQAEAVSRDRAYAAGRTEVGSHRQACVEALESATHRIDTRAAELRGPK